MKKPFTFITICAIIAGGTFVIWKAANFENTKFNAGSIDRIPLGNKLSIYFYYINTDKITSRYFINYHKKETARTKDPQLKKFFQQFQWEIKRNTIDFDSMPDSAHAQLQDGAPKKNYLMFWQTTRPQIKAFYNRHLRTYLTLLPVIHLRCSDSPFNKHPQYHLTKASTATWMARQIAQRGYNEVILLSCNGYRSLDEQSCAKYIDFYKQIFVAEGLNVTTQCNSLLHDFELMVSAPLLVSLNYSSFSFMAGIAKEPQNYISCNGGVEYADKYVLQSEADWLLSHEAPLLHRDVSDYNNPDAVIQQLKG